MEASLTQATAAGQKRTRICSQIAVRGGRGCPRKHRQPFVGQSRDPQHEDPCTTRQGLISILGEAPADGSTVI